jgi:predicted Zn-dependent peptidase
MTAVAIRFPVGSAQDPAGQEGTANLLGDLLQDAANSQLVASGAEVLVEVGAEEFLLTLLTPPDRWKEGVGVVEGLLFRGDLAQASADLESIRREIIDVLTFERGSPVREFEVARSSLIRGEGAPGARPSMGSVNSVSLLTFAALDRYRQAYLTRGSAMVAVTGPVVPSDAEATFGLPVRVIEPGGARILPPIVAAPEAPFPGGVAIDTVQPPAPLGPSPRAAADSSPLRVPAVPTSGPAWSVGERIETDRELTSTWIAAAYPLPPGSPPVLLEFLSHLVEEALNPSPPDPGLYQVESELTWLDDRPILLISASVDPRTVGAWEERILGIMPELAESPPTGSFFDLARRRFRSALLIGLAAPENRVRWAVREASRPDAASLAIENDLWRLDREGVAGAAAAALPPRVRMIGPLGMRAPQ